MAELNYAKKRLQPIIEKFGINPETDQVFQSIIVLFDGQTDYQMWGVKIVFSKAASLDTLIAIKEWADSHPTEISSLSLKNLVSYKTSSDMSKLMKEMASLDGFQTVKNFINTFNTAQRGILKTRFISPVETAPYNAFGNKEFYKFFKLVNSFCKLPSHRKQKFVVLMSAVNSVDDILKHLKSALEASYDWNREDFLLYLQNNCPGSEICFDKDNVVITRLDSFDTAKKLCGSSRTSWCLTRENRFFNQYTSDAGGASQFAIFDFNKKEDHQLAHVGFTVHPERGITNAHSTSNHSMIGDITIDGSRWNIHKVLSHHNVPKTAYIRLKPLRNFKWDKADFIKKLSGKFNGSAKITELADGRLVIPLDNGSIRNFVIDHTLIHNLPSNNETSQVFAVLDFSKEANDENSLICVVFSKDIYGTLSFNDLFECFGSHSSDRKKYEARNLNDEMFIGSAQIDISVLLHKYIDQENIDAAIKLLKEHEGEVNPNKVFYNNLPIIKAILKGRLDLFYALTEHPKFDWNLVEGFGEPYVHFIMLYLGANIQTKGKEPKPYLEMAMHFLKNEKYNKLALDGLKSNLIHGACEAGQICLPLLDYLLTIPELDVNAKNDIGLTPLDTAIEFDNKAAVDVLMSLPNIVVSNETKELARMHNIDLGKKEEPNEPTVVNSDEYEDLFARVFSSL